MWHKEAPVATRIRNRASNKRKPLTAAQRRQAEMVSGMGIILTIRSLTTLVRRLLLSRQKFSPRYPALRALALQALEELSVSVSVAVKLMRIAQSSKRLGKPQPASRAAKSISSINTSRRPASRLKTVSDHQWSPNEPWSGNNW